MDTVTILYWRDIPAQVIAGRGRRAEKHVLPDRFAEAIDRAAMRGGLAGSDDYLAQWRKVDGPAAPHAVELDTAPPPAATARAA